MEGTVCTFPDIYLNLLSVFLLGGNLIGWITISSALKLIFMDGVGQGSRTVFPTYPWILCTFVIFRRLSVSQWRRNILLSYGDLCPLRTSTCKPRSVLRLIKRDTRENTFLFYDTHWLWQNIVWQYPDGKSWLVCFFCEDFNAGTLLFTLQRDSCVEVRPAICVTVYDRLEMVWHGLKG